MAGYLKNEKATKETVDTEGWLHTGDVAYYDEDEYCVIVNKGGQQLLPANIMLLVENICAIDNEPWAVEEDDDYNKKKLKNLVQFLQKNFPMTKKMKKNVILKIMIMKYI